MIRKILLSLLVLFSLTACPWDDKKEKHDAFVGDAPEESKPYNIMDYTKPAPKP